MIRRKRRCGARCLEGAVRIANRDFDIGCRKAQERSYARRQGWVRDVDELAVRAPVLRFSRTQPAREQKLMRSEELPSAKFMVAGERGGSLEEIFGDRRIGGSKVCELRLQRQQIDRDLGTGQLVSVRQFAQQRGSACRVAATQSPGRENECGSIAETSCVAARLPRRSRG